MRQTLSDNGVASKVSLRGLAYGGGSYVLWGLLPIYWKLLASASPFEIFAHRMFWAFVFMFVIVVLIRRRSILYLLRSRRCWLILGTAALAIGCSWFIYIYSVTSGQIVEASLGYFINPIFSIALGMMVFKERLTILQKVALALAAIGVLYFSFSYGSFPWIALSLAGLFAVYGALKKKGGYPADDALTMESMILAPVGLAFIVMLFLAPGHAFLADVSSPDSWLLTIGLIVGGAVTATPLLLFALGANAVPLSWMGFLQYLSPSISLLLGVLAFGEPFTMAHAICFAFIWAGLALISGEMLIKWRRAE